MCFALTKSSLIFIYHLSSSNALQAIRNSSQAILAAVMIIKTTPTIGSEIRIRNQMIEEQIIPANSQAM